WRRATGRRAASRGGPGKARRGIPRRAQVNKINAPFCVQTGRRGCRGVDGRREGGRTWLDIRRRHPDHPLPVVSAGLLRRLNSCKQPKRANITQKSMSAPLLFWPDPTSCNVAELIPSPVGEGEEAAQVCGSREGRAGLGSGAAPCSRGTAPGRVSALLPLPPPSQALGASSASQAGMEPGGLGVTELCSSRRETNPALGGHRGRRLFSCSGQSVQIFGGRACFGFWGRRGCPAALGVLRGPSGAGSRVLGSGLWLCHAAPGGERVAPHLPASRNQPLIPEREFPARVLPRCFRTAAAGRLGAQGRGESPAFQTLPSASSQSIPERAASAGIACPPGIVPPEKRPPEPPGPPPPPPVPEGDLSAAAQELNPALLSQPDAEPPDYGRSHPARTYSADGSEGGFAAEELDPAQTLLEPSAQALGKSRTFSGSVSHLGESSGYQGAGSAQFPGDQDLRFARAPVGVRSLGQSFSKSEGSTNNAPVHPEAKMQSYGELGPGTAACSGAGTGAGFLREDIPRAWPSASAGRPGPGGSLLRFPGSPPLPLLL
ncbi:hypothetical protein DV515_00017652, partial [Chloebia gouldiae]